MNEAICTDAGIGYIAADSLSLCQPMWSKYQAMCGLMTRFCLHQYDIYRWVIL